MESDRVNGHRDRARPSGRKRSRLVFLVGVCSVVAAVDLAAKSWAVQHAWGKTVTILRSPVLLAFRYFSNPGTVGGLGGGFTRAWVWTGLVLIGAILTTLIFSESVLDRAWLGTGLLLGGTVSNLYDRISCGHVRDYIIAIWDSGIFNLADVAITVGLACIGYSLLRHPRREVLAGDRQDRPIGLGVATGLILLSGLSAGCTESNDSVGTQLSHYMLSRPLVADSPEAVTEEAPTVGVGTILALAEKNAAPVIEEQYAIASSEVAFRAVRSAYWPKLDLSASISHPITGRDLPEKWRLRDSSALTIGLNWDVFSFLTAAADERRASAELKIAGLKHTLARKEAAAKAVLLYVDYWATVRLVELAVKSSNLAHRKLEGIRALLEAKLASRKDFQTAMDSLTLLQARQISAEQTAAYARQRLLAFLDLRPATKIVAPPADLRAESDRLMMDTPLAVELGESVRASQLAIEVARDAEAFSPWRRWLDISTGLRFGQDLLDSSATSTPVYMVLSWRIPILDGGASGRLQDQALLARKTALLRSREATKMLAGKINELRVTTARSQASLLELQQMTRVARKNSKVASDEFANRTISGLDLREVELALAAAESQEAAAQLKLVSLAVATDLLMGRDPRQWFRPPLRGNSNDPDREVAGDSSSDALTGAEQLSGAGE